ncbi:hypothetical protein hrd7_01700 [Leptolinea sp. HRD-7]|nr:hypothetical protein hrd7_01700 [Leptolinea sp. HRD-7]
MSHYLEEIWDDILSRRPARIRRRFNLLDESSRQEVLNHLKKMTTEEGWQDVQVESAQAALNALATESRSAK